jgi:hypothetical protein
VRAEHCPAGSTGGTAPLYDGCMRNSTLITLALFSTPLLSCADEAPTRPQDGTVKVWGACSWDGQLVFELCDPALVCTWHGVCAPTCTEVDDCPVFEGFENECGPMEDKTICEPRCNEVKDCPETNGVALICHQGYCIGEIGGS